MVRAAAFGLAIGLLALVTSDGRASLHHPDDRTGVVPVDEQGAPEAYPFEELKRRRLVLRNVGNPEWPLEKIDPQTKEKVIDPKTGEPRLSDRGVVDARIKKAREKKEKERTEAESVALAIDLLHFNRLDDAEGALRGRRSGFLPTITHAHIAATRGDWPRAYEFLYDANDEKPPAALVAKSPKFIEWQRKLDRGALLKLVKLRMAETRGPKPPPEDELPDRIFDVNFVNDAGQYEPGKLAAAEQAKLPPDALATVQQLVLWFPFDVRLYWLLGELYAAKGDFKSALDIMNECADSGRYSNRKVLMQHREAVAKLANVEPPVEDPPPPFSVDWFWIVVYSCFGLAAAFGLYSLVRAVRRARKVG